VDNLSLHIESLIFASENAISFDEIKTSIQDTLQMQFEDHMIEDSVNFLIEKYNSDQFSMEIVEISGGFTFMSKGAYHLTISNYLKQITTKKLSRAAMETLAIISYKQPISKSEVEIIRGVNCDYSVQKLLEKELIEIAGRSESVGKPLLYGTTQKFFDYFGLRDMTDLPKIKDLDLPENEIGEPSPEEYVVSIDNAHHITVTEIDEDNVSILRDKMDVYETANDEQTVIDLIDDSEE
jgi:segregation and condensation protein B